MYYHLPTSTLRGPGRLERKLSDGALLGPPDTGWSPQLAALCGFVPVVETDPPTVTGAQVAESTVALVGGVPTRTWSVRPKSAPELAADTSAGNGRTLETKLRAALATNATYLAVVAPTNAQNTAQVKALTRQVNGLVRRTLAADLLDDTAGT